MGSEATATDEHKIEALNCLTQSCKAVALRAPLLRAFFCSSQQLL
jgi:hypothetical protein